MVESTKLRVEIQGLRAFAVVIVVTFHLWPARLRGGYVGVDVFFVISGYLITKHLLSEVARLGRLPVGEFWARRARRLLPAALLVLACSTVATSVWVPAALSQRLLGEVLASTLYVQNWKLATDSVDYFAESNEPSPLQHFWSLSVEEQFYLALPLLLGALLLATRSPQRAALRRPLIAMSLALVVLGSFAYAITAAASDPAPAYFSTAARAFEFGSGALLSFAGPAPASWVRRCVAWCGLGALAGGVGWMGRVVPFDPIASSLSVLGTMAILWAGDGGGVEPALLCRPPVIQWLGGVSYSLYLWHWPLLTLLPHALERPLSGLDELAIVVASLVLAGFTRRYVEDPIRFAGTRACLHRPQRVAAWSLAGMGGVVGIAAVCLPLTPTDPTPTADRLQARDPLCFGARAMRSPPAACARKSRDVVPPLTALPFDDVIRPDCRVEADDPEVRTCALGPHSGYAKRLAAIGDSHAAALLPALEIIAQTRRWRIDVAAKNSCYWTSAAQPNRSAVNQDACERWKAELERRLAEMPPYEAILVTHSASRYPPLAAAGSTQEATIVSGLLDTWRRQVERGTRIIAIRDNPVAGPQMRACVTRNLQRANERCSLSRRQALAAFDGSIRAVQSLPGSHLIDLSDYYCRGDTCPAIIGSVIVYRDASHITATFARTLAPFLQAELEKVLGQPPIPRSG